MTGMSVGELQAPGTGVALTREDREGATGAADLRKAAACLQRTYGDLARSVAHRRALTLARSGDGAQSAIWVEIANCLTGDLADSNP